MFAMSPWIRSVKAGVYVLRHVDGEALDDILRSALNAYRGPDMGGLDVMVPDASREAWLLIGRWADCWEPEVQQSAELLLERLMSGIDLWNAGVRHGADGITILDGTHAFKLLEGAPRVAISPLLSYRGILDVGYEAARQALEPLVRRSTDFAGFHMGAPHWLGTGMSRDGDRITSVTPYVRLDFTPERGITLSAMAEPVAFEAWLERARQITGWA